MKNYYEENAEGYILDTKDCDMTQMYSLFLKYLQKTGTILDLGFGSGRDALYFISKEYEVFAIDPTKVFCDKAKKLGLKNIYNIYAQDMEFVNLFEGIWACASLLHIPSKDLNIVFGKCSNALKKNGIMYASFKYGTFEGIKNDRFFTYMDEQKIIPFIENTGFKIVEQVVSMDVRENRKDEKWINFIFRKQ